MDYTIDNLVSKLDELKCLTENTEDSEAITLVQNILEHNFSMSKKASELL